MSFACQAGLRSLSELVWRSFVPLLFLDSGNEAGVLESSYARRFAVVRDPLVADIDIGIADGEIVAGTNTQRNIIAASRVLKERTMTISGVVDAGCVVKERSCAKGCIGLADCIIRKGISAVGRVVAASAVILESECSCGGVA